MLDRCGTGRGGDSPDQSGGHRWGSQPSPSLASYHHAERALSRGEVESPPAQYAGYGPGECPGGPAGGNHALRFLTWWHRGVPLPFQGPPEYIDRKTRAHTSLEWDRNWSAPCSN